MGIPHKHAEVIKAWADGATIQWRVDFLMWLDVKDNNPAWLAYNEYRVKPETVKVRYRVCLLRQTNGGLAPFAVSDPVSSIEDTDFFVKWITDWIEVEVEK